MATLLIILLSTVLIQGSTIALGHASQPTSVRARGALVNEFGTALFTLLTLTLATMLGYLVNQVWLPTAHLEYLSTAVLIFSVSLIWLAVRSLLIHFDLVGAMREPNLLTHLTTHCALLGMALFGAIHADSLLEAVEYGAGCALALAVLSACFNALRERIDSADVPTAFQGIPVALITAGFIALALMGFVGLVRN